MEEADKDWMMIRMVGGWVFLLVLAHPGTSPRCKWFAQGPANATATP